MLKNKHWVDIRKALLAQVKSQVLLLTGQLTVGLKAYAETYEKEFEGPWKISTHRTLVNNLKKARLVLGGEFHAFSQSQRAHLRILRDLPDQRPVVLALECFEFSHQKYIDAYFEGKITEDMFLKKVSWAENWGFPWLNYKPLMELARARNIKVVGVNKVYQERTPETLLKRDIYSAQRIQELLKTYKDSMIYVIYGEWHLSIEHLYGSILKLSPELEGEVIRIMQNSEKLYFEISSDQKESQVQVLEGEGNKYCLMNSPPWIQWQSYLMFMEKTFDLTHCEDEEDHTIDYTDHLYSQLKFIIKNLNIKVNFDDLAVYSSTDETVWNILETKVSAEQKPMVDYYIKNDRSFYLAESNVLYLSRPSINHLSTLAGLYLQKKLSDRTTTPFQMPQFFIQNIWLDSLSFFISKLVNHNRKSETVKSLKLQLASSQPKDRAREVLLLALDQRLAEILVVAGHKDAQRRLMPKNNEVYFEASKILGGMLGDKLYQAYRQDKVSSKEVVGWLEEDIFSSHFIKSYYKKLSLVESIKINQPIEGIIYDL